MKKETLILLGVAAAAGFYFYTRNKNNNRGLVTVESPEIITERQFEQRQTSLDSSSPIEKITSIVKTIFPKKTAEQKAAKKLKQQTKKQSRKTKVAGFSDNVLY